MIRPAVAADVPTLVTLVRELALYEREPDAVALTEPLLQAALFGPEAMASALVAQDAGELVGMAIWFRTFSTWTGVAGIHLEDLYVRPQHRGSGHGKALLAALAAECAQRGYARLEWAVLTWNEPALGFYRSLGAAPMEDWSVHRLEGPALRGLARGHPGRGDCSGRGQ